MQRCRETCGFALLGVVGFEGRLSVAAIGVDGHARHWVRAVMETGRCRDRAFPLLLQAGPPVPLF